VTGRCSNQLNYRSIILNIVISNFKIILPKPFYVVNMDFNKKTFEVFDKKQGNEGGGIPAITEHLEDLLQ